MAGIRRMDPGTISRLRTTKQRGLGPMPPLRVVDHRTLDGMPPPPRAHEEPCPSLHHRCSYIAALRRTVTAAGGTVRSDAQGALHITG